MSLIVKTVTRWLKSFLLLFGLYDMLHGHLAPGGGFSGGVIVACAFFLLMLAEGQKTSRKTLSKDVAGILYSIGALVFLGVAVLGMVKAGVFFKNFIETAPEAYFKLFSAGTMLWSNMGIGLQVGTSVFLVLAVLSALHMAVDHGRHEMVKKGEE